MSDDPKIEIIAKAIKECTDRFQSPVMFYIEPEAIERFRKANPDRDEYAVRGDWDMESYRIIARAVIAALNQQIARCAVCGGHHNVGNPCPGP